MGRTLYIEGTKRQLRDFLDELDEVGEAAVDPDERTGLTIVLNEQEEAEWDGGLSFHEVTE